jgi:hypothetical protein
VALRVSRFSIRGIVRSCCLLVKTSMTYPIGQHIGFLQIVPDGVAWAGEAGRRGWRPVAPRAPRGPGEPSDAGHPSAQRPPSRPAVGWGGGSPRAPSEARPPCLARPPERKVVAGVQPVAERRRSATARRGLRSRGAALRAAHPRGAACRPAGGRADEPGREGKRRRGRRAFSPPDKGNRAFSPVGAAALAVPCRRAQPPPCGGVDSCAFIKYFLYSY